MKIDNTTTSKVAFIICLLCQVSLFSACSNTSEIAEGNGVSSRECRGVSTIGSKMKRSVCKTAEEWAKIDEEAAKESEIQNEFFRRVRESAGLSGGGTPSTPSSGPGL
jgi:hypothetical protein